MEMIEDRTYQEDIEQILMSEDKLVLILVLAEGCVENDTSLESLLKEKVEKTEVSLRVLRVCFDEKNMPWPRPLTNSIYYFAPKTTKPLFLRVGPEAIVRFYEDLEISEKMIGGMTYDQAMFDMYYEDDQELIQKTEEMFDNLECLKSWKLLGMTDYNRKLYRLDYK